MEATGVYWKTVFQALEDRFECWLLNAHHLRNVPGRKTDVKDSEWICQLVQHGLVRPSFVPPPEIRRLRDLTRLRKAQINERARSIQRLEKVLQDAGIKLSSVASHDLLEVRAARCSKRCCPASPIPSSSPSSPRPGCARRSRSCAKRSPAASQIEHHGVMVAQLLAHIDYARRRDRRTSASGSSLCSPRTREIVELLCTIPGVQAHAAAGPDRRDAAST